MASCSWNVQHASYSRYRLVTFYVVDLVAATSVGAELLGWSHVGSIAVGKCADIIAVKGNPLESLETLGNVKVCAAGVVAKISLS